MAHVVAQAYRTGTLLVAGWYPISWYRSLFGAFRAAADAGQELPRSIGRLAVQHDMRALARKLDDQDGVPMPPCAGGTLALAGTCCARQGTTGSFEVDSSFIGAAPWPRRCRAAPRAWRLSCNSHRSIVVGVRRSSCNTLLTCARRSPRRKARSGLTCAAGSGVWFRRQVVVGRFVADFAAASVKRVVEVDGTAHARRAAADARRDRALARLGWRVVRLPAALVLSWPLEAVALVREALMR